MTHLKDILSADGWTISLSKLTGKAVKDVTGYLAYDHDDVYFKVCDIVMADDTIIGVEGENDFPYLSFYPGENAQPNCDDETLGRIYCEDPEHECDNDE